MRLQPRSKIAVALVAIIWTAAASAQQSEMPNELIGVWSDKNSAGRKHCMAYRAHPLWDRDGYDPLVGSVVITKTLIHSYAEYGEGNFYQIDLVSRTGAARWLVRSYLYVDTPPPGGPATIDRTAAAYRGDTMTLNGRTLVWTGPEAEARTLFRCGDLIKSRDGNQ